MLSFWTDARTPRSPLPAIVASGRKPDVRACGSCHRSEGTGGPENASLAGLPVAYFVQQIADFKSGARKSSGPQRSGDSLMAVTAKAMTDAEIHDAAEYFSSLKPKQIIKVVESDNVPKTYIARLFFAKREDGGTEPLGSRVVEFPNDVEQFELRDSRSQFTAYVPVGSIAKGEALAKTGGSGATVPCAICHGSDFRGIGPIPGIAGRQLPEVALICNFPGGKAEGSHRRSDGHSDDPGLMQYSDVVTFFHEFGHLMHAILGGQQSWAGVSGIATEGDFVEVPSQMLEEFFHDAQLLASFARHYQTGEPIPPALVERMNRASAFGRADGVRTQLFYTSYALDVHNLPPQTLDPDALLEQGYKRMMPYEWVDGNRMYASFTHLIGYTSNYYTYMFDKVIALDFFGQFDRSNLLEGPTAMRYRRTILEPGGSKPGTQLIEDFLGRQQKMDAFAEWVGEEFAGSSAGEGSDGVSHSA